MSFKLGINTGFALNRFPGPENWIPIVGDTLGLRYCQLTADLINPSLPSSLILKNIKKINQLCQKYQVKINSTFTGAFTRVNHLAHSDPEVRKYWAQWFKKFIDISVDVGAESMGSHFGILSQEDFLDSQKRKIRTQEAIDNWHLLADYGQKKGLKFLSWEPMSIGREFGETIKKASKLQQMLNENSPLPFKICLDVDHGDIQSNDPRDFDPYAWISSFAKDAPLIHLKQSQKDKGGHWPFTAYYNERGKINPTKILQALRECGPKEATLYLELSFKEREPFDSSVIPVLKESVDYWREAGL